MSWVATLLTFVGVWQLGEKRVSGWWLCLGGCALWIIYAIFTGQPALWTLNAALAGINIRGLWKWRKRAVLFEEGPRAVE